MKFTLIAVFALALTVSCGSQDTKSTKKDVEKKAVFSQKKSEQNVITNTDQKNIKRITVAGTSVTKNVNKAEFASLVASGKGMLVDVRTPDEFSKGNIEGAVNIDINNSMFTANISKLDRKKPVYVYCQSGGRSSKAMALMKKLGFKEIYNLQGGYSGWIAE